MSRSTVSYMIICRALKRMEYRREKPVSKPSSRNPRSRNEWLFANNTSPMIGRILFSLMNRPFRCSLTRKNFWLKNARSEWPEFAPKFMVWGGISQERPTRLKILRLLINSAEWISTTSCINDFLLPFSSSDEFPNGSEFQQDSSTCHALKMTKIFFRTEN